MAKKKAVERNPHLDRLQEYFAEVKHLAAFHGRRCAFVVNHSGGKDSHRMLGFIVEHFGAAHDIYVVMADTGFEHIKPVSAEEFARANVARFGLELHVVRNPNKTYLEMVEERGMFPSTDQRQCTSDLKRGPISVLTRNLPKYYPCIINCMGIRAAESTKRRKKNPWKPNDELTILERRRKDGTVYQKARFVYDWMPIFGESLKEVLEWHWKVGHPLHPVYIPAYHFDGTTGGYLRRLSCRLCIFSSPADIKAIHANDPDAFYAVAFLEEKINFTMKNGANLFQILGQDDDGSQYGSEEIYREDVYDRPCI